MRYPTAMARTALVVLLGAALLCAAAVLTYHSGVGNGSSTALGGSIPPEELTREVQDRFGSYDDTLELARAAGFDYIEVVARCLTRDRNAMHHLFRMSDEAGFDAASSEGHAEVLNYVLRDVGERFFVECLSDEAPDVQGDVRDDVAYDIGYSSRQDVEYMCSQYPRLLPAPYYPPDYGTLPARTILRTDESDDEDKDGGKIEPREDDSD